MSAAVLLTACALCAVLCCVLVWLSWRYARDASEAAISLQTLRGRVLGLEAGLESLHSAHRKLAGRVYADEYWAGQRPEQPQLEVDDLPRAPMGEACENWAQAQRDGPRSPAAKCACAYCESRRADRARQRAAIVPKTAQGQGELAKLNAGKP